MTVTPTVVTGLGVVAPNGVGTERYWSAALAGRTGIGPITRFDATGYATRVAGEVRGFDAREHLPNRVIPQTDHGTHLGLAAAGMALADAGVDPAALPEYAMAVVVASSSGGTEFGQHEIERLWSQGPQFVSVYQSIAWFYAATTGQISILHGMRGPSGVIATEQAGGLDAIGQARRLLDDTVQLVVTGGTDASLCPYGLTAQMATGALSRSDDPVLAYRPFATDPAGYVPGEGGAVLIVETAEHAAARGAPQWYGEIAGYAASFDPPPASGRPPTLLRAVHQALADARCTPEDIDVVFADAAALPASDRDEAAVVAEVFGPHGVAVTAPKTMTGRLYAGGAALDVASALLALRDHRIPPTAGDYLPAREHHLDLVVGAARDADLRTALVLARGHGGFNAAMVLRACPTDRRDQR